MLRVASSSRRVGRMRKITYSTTAPMGRLTKKIQCQLMLSVIRPPMAGPMIELSPKTAPKKPRYLPRSDGEKMSPMMAIEIGKSAPAPSPCSPRNAMNCHMVCERPESSDPTRKMPTPARKRGRLPKRSDSLP